MTALSSEKILQEQNTSDPNSITSLTLTHRAVSDVSCLGEFKNLERLDLGFNNLTSLEGLKSCTNLKWLSVVQNKLQSLKGIEGLSRLTVFNAGKNKLTSINEVKSLSSLRALILNDNEISSLCKLDQMTELNTLVLSRNPISSLGESLVKRQSITKLSLSNCRLQKVDSSLRSCLELKELRLAHNEIMTIPVEFGNFVKLQNLDLGNNLIASWSNMKVLSSLVNMTNLNLKGNPIAKKEKLQKKVKKLLPNLHIFNARLIDKIAAKEGQEKAIDFSVESGDRLNRQSETKIDHPMRNDNSSKAHSLSENMDNQLTCSGDLGFKNKRKELHDEQGVHDAEITNISGKRKKKNSKLQQDTPSELDLKSDNVGKGKDLGKKSSKLTKEGRANVPDSAETPFVDLFVTGASEDPVEAAGKKLDRKMVHAADGVKMVVTYPTKKKNKKNHAVIPSMLEASQVGDIGLGGPSAWDA